MDHFCDHSKAGALIAAFAGADDDDAAAVVAGAGDGGAGPAAVASADAVSWRTERRAATVRSTVSRPVADQRRHDCRLPFGSVAD